MRCGARTISRMSNPTTITRHRPPMPARTAPKTSTNTENSHGATKDTARPVIVERPKATPSFPALDILSSSVRADACAGPMNRHSSRPVIQNARGPDNAIMASPAAMMLASDPMMTGLEPTRASRNPAEAGASRSHHAGGHAEDQHIGRRDPVRVDTEHAAEGEDAGQSV